MKKKELTQTRAYKVVTIITMAVFAVSCIETIMLSLSFYDYSKDVLMWPIWYIVGQFIPGIVFGVIWLLTRGSRWERLYQASLLTIATTLFTSALSTVVYTFVWPPVFSLFDGVVAVWLLNGLPLALQLLAASGLAVLLRHHVDVQQSLRFVVTVLLIALCTFFVTNIAQTAYQVLSQYPDNQNLSGFVQSFIAYGVVIVLFVITWMLEKRSGAQHSLRTAAIVTSAGMQVVYVVSYPVGLLTSVYTGRWFVAIFVTVCCVVAMYGYRWLYKNMRVLA